MMIRRRSLLSSCSCVSVFVVALAIVCTSTHLSTVQAFSSPSFNTHHKSLPSTSTSTLSSFTLSQRVNRIVLPNYHSVPRTITTQYRRQHHTKATISTTTCHASAASAIVNHGITTFMSNWKSYSLIPLVAGFVGWFTNYLAVQMIFYPIKWRGLPIYKVEGEPLGLLGWQGEVFDRCVLFCFRHFDDTHTSSLCPVLDGWNHGSLFSSRDTYALSLSLSLPLFDQSINLLPCV